MGRVRSRKEERINAATHGFGFVVALVMTPWLVWQAVEYGSWRLAVGYAVFGITVLIVLGASALYHLETEPGRKERLRLIDHICIYWVIAGGYTPYCLAALPTSWGWMFLLCIWVLATVGFVFKLNSSRRYSRVSHFAYLALGWMCVLVLRPLWLAIPAESFWLLAGAGGCFTFGLLIYLLDHYRVGMHAVWHLCVLGGFGCLAGSVYRLLPS